MTGALRYDAEQVKDDGYVDSLDKSVKSIPQRYEVVTLISPIDTTS